MQQLMHWHFSNRLSSDATSSIITPSTSTNLPIAQTLAANQLATPPIRCHIYGRNDLVIVSTPYLAMISGQHGGTLQDDVPAVRSVAAELLNVGHPMIVFTHSYGST
jgi:hypothetical protein